MLRLILGLIGVVWATQPNRPVESGAGQADRRASGAMPRQFIDRHCVSCHDGVTRKGGLDLTKLGDDYGDRATFDTWVRVHDRVRDEEMPPRNAPQPAAGERAAFLNGLAGPLIVADRREVRREGRAVWRRMNREEYENSLRDLLDAPWLQIKEMLPED
ncbi:MAG: c-type cytochrome domain-containing protein, partial [Acidobacteriota bacterium]